jgi:small GTP-binding protein
MEANPRPACKVVMLGNSGVGKTSIVMRWASGTYRVDIPSTIGANHQRKVVSLKDSDIDLFVWDTAGQEQFQALTPLYARSAAAAVVVAAADDLGSFTALDNWTGLLESSCDKVPPRILAINKTDLGDPVLSDEDVHHRYNHKFESIFYVSAKTGEAVEALFLSAAQAAYDFSLHGQAERDSQKIDSSSDANNRCC